jgi:hypothetical protein
MIEVTFLPSTVIEVTFSDNGGGGGSFSCSELEGCTVFTNLQAESALALSTANSATTAASTANTNASNALTAANAATNTANTANSTANTANTTANNVQTALTNLTTTNVGEGSNLYFTTSRVLNAVLTGISFATNSAITAADTILQAFGKLQAQITAVISSLAGKQDTLVSGTNIKTFNGSTILTSGDIEFPITLHSDSTVITISGLTAEQLVTSIPIPTNITGGKLDIAYFQSITTFAAAASARVKIGTIPTPTPAQLATQTQLAQNAAGSGTSINIFRELPIIGGASGSIKAPNPTGNILSDETTAGLLTTIPIDWTVQQYIYLTAVPSNTGNTLTSNGHYLVLTPQ